mgnify:CR=1 FL=1
MRRIIVLRIHKRHLTKLIAVIKRVFMLVAFVEVIIPIVSGPVQIILLLVLLVQIVFYLMILQI